MSGAGLGNTLSSQQPRACDSNPLPTEQHPSSPENIQGAWILWVTLPKGKIPKCSSKEPVREVPGDYLNWAGNSPSFPDCCPQEGKTLRSIMKGHKLGNLFGPHPPSPPKSRI